jgi:hypothetical protein
MNIDQYEDKATNREPLNREPNNLCSYKSPSYVIVDLMEESLRDLRYFW